MAEPKKTKRPKTIPNFLKPREVASLEADKQVQMDNLRSGDPKIDKASCVKNLKKIDKMLEQAPPDLTPEQRTKVAKKIEELEADIKVGMLSHQEMRANPDGAVDQNIAWLKQKKAKVFAWQNLNAALHKGIPQEMANDLFNVDRLRPRTNQLNLDSAQVSPANFYFMSDPYEGEHAAAMVWEEVFPSDPEKAALQQELEEARAALAAEREAIAAANAKTLAEQVAVANQVNPPKQAHQNNQQRR
jgi:hypothetical protein